MPPFANIPRVAVWIETSRGYGRGLIRGVAQYVRQHGPWSIYFTPHGQEDPLPNWLRRWRGDGILARIEHRQTARLLLATKLPLIDLSCRLPGLRSPIFGISNQPVAQMAFEHLHERGLRHYGFFGLPQGKPNRQLVKDYCYWFWTFGKGKQLCLSASRHVVAKMCQLSRLSKCLAG
jgi:LacI family transcriptional regulator